MKTIAAFALLCVIQTGCVTPENQIMRLIVEYTYSNDSIEVVSMFPEIKSHEIRRVVINNYKNGFTDTINEKDNGKLILIHWEDSKIGRFGESAYLKGVKDARKYLHNLEKSH